MKTDQQKENMRKHIAFLRENSDSIRNDFNMNRYRHPCGTPSCSLGYAVLSTGVKKEECYANYSEVVFGVSGWEPNPEFEYMFSENWTRVNNTPEAAAARMEAVLYNQVPKDWNYTTEFAHPVVNTMKEEIHLVVS